jgi:hypothetical protein
MTMLATALLIVAALLFLLASINPTALAPHQGRLMPLGLLFAVLAFLVPMLR